MTPRFTTTGQSISPDTRKGYSRMTDQRLPLEPMDKRPLFKLRKRDLAFIIMTFGAIGYATGAFAPAGSSPVPGLAANAHQSPIAGEPK